MSAARLSIVQHTRRGVLRGYGARAGDATACTHRRRTASIEQRGGIQAPVLTTASSLTPATPTWKRGYLTQHTRQIGKGEGGGAGRRQRDSGGADLYVVLLYLRYHRRPVGRCSSPIDSWEHGKLRVGSDGGSASTGQPVNGLALRQDPRTDPCIRTPR